MGEDSDLWRVRVMGAFPNAGSSSLLSLAWLEAAISPGEALEAREGAPMRAWAG